MEEKITHDLDTNIYHHIRQFEILYDRTLKLWAATVNRITLLWIITLIIYIIKG